MLKLLLLKSNKIENKLENKIENEIENKLENKIENKLENEIENKLENKIIFLELSCYHIDYIISPWYKKNEDTGIGNMLFQISSCIAYAIEHKCKYYVPSLNTYFKSEELNKENTIFRYVNTDLIEEYKNKIIINCNNDNFIHNYPFINFMSFNGYLENYLNFNNHKSVIYDYFLPNKTDIDFILNKYNKIQDDNSCSIHIRGNKKYLEAHTNNIELYILSFKKCIDYMIEKKNIKTLYVLTNDKSFSELIINDYVNNLEIIFTNEIAYIDLWIISLIKNNITSWSTLSWWGSYLNRNTDKFIVSHKTFYKNFFLPEWIIID